MSKFLRSFILIFLLYDMRVTANNSGQNQQIKSEPQNESVMLLNGWQMFLS